MIFFGPRRGQFNGVIGYLNKYFYSSLYSHVNIEVSSSNSVEAYSYPKAIVNFRNLSAHWALASSHSNESAELIFPSNKVYITHYTIQTRRGAPENFPKSWMIEGSYDKITWIKLHSMTDSTDLFSPGAKKTYRVNINSAFSYFKVTQTDVNMNNSRIFHLERLELFGSFCSNNEDCFLPLYPPTKCQSFRNPISNKLLFLIIAYS